MRGVVLITGGTGAIGGSFAKALALADYKVIIMGRGKTKPVEEAAADINALLGEVSAKNPVYGINCDASDEKAFGEALDKISREHGTPGILVNAAGGNKGRTPFVDVDVEVFKEVVDMNLVGGLVIPTKHLADRWIKEGIQGSIINIASMASYLPLSGVWAYAASKAGVMNLTMGLAMEFAPYGIRVNGIAPGFFVGSQNRNLLYDDPEKEVLSARGKSIIDHTPFRRFGKLEDLNGTLLFLCDSGQSGFVTGVTIPVDGGYLVHNV